MEMVFLINKKNIARSIMLINLILAFSSIGNAAYYELLRMTDQIDCNNHCTTTVNPSTGLLYPSGECRRFFDTPCASYTDSDWQGIIGECSGAFADCQCCYNADTCDSACQAEDYNQGYT